MRAFIVLCLVAVACADHLGYNYHPVDQSYSPGGGVGSVGASSDAGPSFAGVSSGPSFAASSSGPSFEAVGAGPSFGAAGSGPSFAATSSGPVFAAGQDFGASQGDYGVASNDAPVAAGGLEKEFYTFTADEQDFNDPAASNQIASSLKQGLRVVFIKGPESSGLEDAALALAKSASDQKTDIYVLSKQADLSSLANRLNTENTNANNKPEVHFVKYRTSEDAVNAQKTIQAEYDNLGGNSQHFDGGVASSLNFASQAPVAPAAGGNQGSFGAVAGPAGVAAGGQQGSFGAASGPSSTYLPASVLRLFRL